MGKIYPVIVECSKFQKKKHKRKLKRLHTRYSYKENGIYYFCGRLNERRFETFKYYCMDNHLKFRINNEFGTRSATYRKEFFKHNPPCIGKYYFCSYCGIPLTRKTLTVDHLYPVGAVSKDIKLQKKLKRKGIHNINDVKNLVPACSRCNGRKGKKMGKWILKGEIGRHQKLWVVRHLVRIAVLVLLAWCVINFEAVQKVVAKSEKELQIMNRNIVSERIIK